MYANKARDQSSRGSCRERKLYGRGYGGGELQGAGTIANRERELRLGGGAMGKGSCKEQNYSNREKELQGKGYGGRETTWEGSYRGWECMGSSC